ncbi:MAG: Hpt domain-containing protein [Cytophagales bacterium]|nr:MAG: Hpt domain-containing protein [Cytophagales bacterium]
MLMAVIDAKVIANLKALGKDKNFLTDLINLFVKESPTLVDAMQKHHKAGDAAAMASAAHKYKSSSRQLGATKLSEMCLSVEQAGKAGKQNDKIVAETIAKIKDESATAIKELKVILENHLKGK